MLNSHISAIYLQKYKKIFRKVIIWMDFVRSELDLTLFYKIEEYFDNLKSLMTVTLMTSLCK